MSKTDVTMEEDLPQLYKSVRKMPDGSEEVLGYAYGLPWVATALWMGDIKFSTPEAAQEWWERRYGNQKA